MRINDTQIATFSNQMTVQIREIDEKSILQLLGAIGDRVDFSDKQLVEKFEAAFLTRQEQLDFVAKGMTDEEKSDLKELLQDPKLKWTPGTRNFVEALVGLSPLLYDHGPLAFNSDLSNGLQGVAKSEEDVEFSNLSSSQKANSLRDKGTFTTTADKWGKFSGTLPDVQEGDYLKVRSSRYGKASDWITIQANGLGSDTRNATADLTNLSLETHSNGRIYIKHPEDSAPTEPFSEMLLSNKRTGKEFKLQADYQGVFNDSLYLLEGQAGDKFSVAISDGKNNADFKEIAGTLQVVQTNNKVDLVDPNPLKSAMNADGSSRQKKTRFEGPLIHDGISLTDVKQGSLADCYFASTLGAMAHAQPDFLEKMMKDNGDGTYTFTFYGDWESENPKVEVTVDGELYTSYGESPVYGKSIGTPQSAKEMELWYPLLEKAYAEFSGGFENMGNGGEISSLLMALTGVSTQSISLKGKDKDVVFQQIKEAAEQKSPMAAATYDKKHTALYSGSGLYAWHVYTVLGAEEDPTTGKKTVQLRNPWGNSEPGNDGKDDGIFKLPLDDFMKYYASFDIGYV